MPSEKLARILKAKSPYTSEEIEAMSDIDGWNWVYANTKKNVEKLSQICFTGFNAKEKTILTTIATESKLEVVPSVAKNLAFLCAGENAGPAKLQKAVTQGTRIISREQLMQLIETGEILVDYKA